MIALEISCSMCGKILDSFFQMSGTDNAKSIKKMIERESDWIVQLNGNHIDTYCCKECAE